MEEKTPWIGECFRKFDSGAYDTEKLLDVEETGTLLSQLLDYREEAREKKKLPCKQLDKELQYCRSAARCSTSPLFPYILHETKNIPEAVMQHAIFLLFTWQFEKSKCDPATVSIPYLSENDLRAVHRNADSLGTGDERAVEKQVKAAVREALYAWKKLKKRMPRAEEKELAQKMGAFIDTGDHGD